MGLGARLSRCMVISLHYGFSSRGLFFVWRAALNTAHYLAAKEVVYIPKCVCVSSNLLLKHRAEDFNKQAGIRPVD